MSGMQVGGLKNFNFVNKKRIPGDDGQQLSSAANFVSTNTMRTALATADGVYFTSNMLNKMTANDMVYALRVLTENNIAANGTI